MKLDAPKIGAFLAVATLAAGCASTKITSFRGPTLTQKPTIMVVSVEHPDLSLRTMGEKEFAKYLDRLKIRALPWTSLMFPGRSYEADEIKRIIIGSGATAVLRVSAQAADGGVAYGAPTTTTHLTPTYGGGFTATSTTSPGMVVPWATASYEARLHDATTAEVLWYAVMASEGVYVEQPSLIRNMAWKTIRQLRKDGVF